MTSNITPFDLRKLGNLLHKNRDEFLEILIRIGTRKSAEDEINHAVETLNGAPEELYGINGKIINQLAVYLPPNVILFSYILYMVMPSPYTGRIFFRPSVRCRDEVYAIHQKIVNLINLPVTMSYESRSVFWNKFTTKSDMIIFNGKCQNVFEVGQAISSNQIFLYFGTGVNPFIVGQDADIDIAAKDAVTIRINNSGQDCLCPDLFLVHENIVDKFVNELKTVLNTKIFGEKSQMETDYSNLSYPDVTEFSKEFLIKNKHYIVYGGNTDVLERYVQPTILLRNISELHSLPEFFAPIFNIATYANEDEIKSFLNSRMYKNKAMGATFYGAEELIPLFRKKHMVTIGETLLEINHGNRPFGGWDKCASHIRYKNKIISQPLLISDVVKEYLILFKG